MKDWIKKLDSFLRFNEKEIFYDIGKVSNEVAIALAEREFGKYNTQQDKLLVSDFDELINALP